MTVDQFSVHLSLQCLFEQRTISSDVEKESGPPGYQCRRIVASALLPCHQRTSQSLDFHAVHSHQTKQQTLLCRQQSPDSSRLKDPNKFLYTPRSGKLILHRLRGAAEGHFLVSGLQNSLAGNKGILATLRHDYLFSLRLMKWMSIGVGKWRFMFRDSEAITLITFFYLFWVEAMFFFRIQKGSGRLPVRRKA